MGDKKHKSDSYIIAAILFFIGGFQNTYTYLNCNKIFANLQTGNMVLMSVNLAQKNYLLALRYLVPLSCFIFGCVVGTIVDINFKKKNTRFHYRTIVLFIEMLCVVVVGFIPDQYDLISAGIITFNSALSLQAFRTVEKRPLPSTMMIGNMRNLVEHLTRYFILHKKEDLREFCLVSSLLLIFLFSCFLMALLNNLFYTKTIWFLVPLYIFAIIYLEND